jgi:hypothetical protein
MTQSFTTAARFTDALHRVAACAANGLNNRTCAANGLNNRNGNNNRLTGRAIA